MKKLISALLILTMLTSMVCVSTSAAGIVFKPDFSAMDDAQFYTKFMNGLFFIDDASGLLCGYYEAKALQSLYVENPDTGLFNNVENTWLTYDASITLRISDDDATESERCVTIAYCNDNRRALGEVEGREFITLCYDIDNKKFDVVNANGPLYDSEAVIGESIPMDLPTEGDAFFTLGMSIDKNRVRFFVNDQLLYDIDGTQYRVGESFNSPFFLWNGGNFMEIKELVVSSAGYLYPYPDAGEVTTEGTTAAPAGDDNKVTENTTKVTTTATSNVVVTNDKGEQVTDESGNKVTSQVVITEAPDTAATNTGKPAGGSSTSTGDATFVVIAVMVAALGCALIVKKVNA